jgi:hypothetical protein
MAELNLRAFKDEYEANLKKYQKCEGAEEILEVCVKEFPIMIERVKAAWAEKDIERVLLWLGNHMHMAFVCDNFLLLKESGVYEKALLHALTSPRVNNANISSSTLQFLFQYADREKLIKEGDPLPGPGPFVVYRGVAGRGAKRRLRGLSWTASLDKAIWFAKRFAELPDMEKPTVYQATVTAEHVYAYSDERNEQEFLCDIPKEMKLKKVWG